MSLHEEIENIILSSETWPIDEIIAKVQAETIERVLVAVRKKARSIYGDDYILLRDAEKAIKGIAP